MLAKQKVSNELHKCQHQLESHLASYLGHHTNQNQAAIDQYAGSGNAKISADSLTGSATFEIVPKSITDVTISGKDQEKTYDGQAASLD